MTTPGIDDGKRLEDRVGLHQSVEVWYVVTGFQANLYVDDGAECVAFAHGRTIREAIDRLDYALAHGIEEG